MIRKDKFIDLGKIYLRGLKESDLSGNWYMWFNDPIVTRFQDKGIIANTQEKQKEYYQEVVRSRSDIILAIIFDETDLHIGNIGLHKIDYIHRNAEVGIVLGEPEYWNKGYASKCITAIRDYAFNTLNLHRLTAKIMTENSGSCRAFSHAGFMNEGLMKEYFFKNGRYLDVQIMGIVNDKK